MNTFHDNGSNEHSCVLKNHSDFFAQLCPLTFFAQLCSLTFLVQSCSLTFLVQSCSLTFLVQSCSLTDSVLVTHRYSCFPCNLTSTFSTCWPMAQPKLSVFPLSPNTVIWSCIFVPSRASLLLHASPSQESGSSHVLL